jgi:DNA-directed RNA polymerase specialized sigma24 family protein
MTDMETKELNENMKILVNLMASQAVRGLDYREQVMFLNDAGLSPKRISDVLGKSQNNINVTLHLAKKEKKNGKKDK